MRRNYFNVLAAVLIVCIAALSACGKKADSSNEANVAADTANVVKNDTKTMLAKFQVGVLNSSGAIYSFIDLDDNVFEFYETENIGKGMDEFMQGIKPNVWDPKFEKILFEVTYNTQPKQFYNGSTGDYDTREVLAIVEIKQVDAKNAELPKPTSLFTPELIKSIMVFGTEPFWDIKFKETHAEYNDPHLKGVLKIYYRKDYDDNSRPKLSEVLRHKNRNTVEILCTMKDLAGSIVITKQQCSDGMSDENYDYAVEFILEEWGTFKGCGSAK
jgi:uncharacterized membrane protein